MRFRRSVADLLNRRMSPHVTAGVGSLYLSARSRRRCLVRYDQGEWIHSYPSGVVVDTFLNPAAPESLDRETEDYFLYGYRPQPGETVLDIGAGVGSEVRLFSRLVGDHGRVVAVEAHPRTAGCLRRAVALNRLTNVTVVECALVGEPGIVHLEDEADRNISNSLTAQRRSAVPVAGRTLADILAQLGIKTVDLLKMNIEGAELPALRGAAEVLPAVRNLVVSCHDFRADRPGCEWQRTFEGVVELLRDSGYHIRTRPDDPRPWVPYYVYAAREPLAARVP